MFSLEELKTYSDCKSMADVKGNIINSETDWDITGTGAEKFEKCEKYYIKHILTQDP